MRYESLVKVQLIFVQRIDLFLELILIFVFPSRELKIVLYQLVIYTIWFLLNREQCSLFSTHVETYLQAYDVVIDKSAYNLKTDLVDPQSQTLVSIAV